MLFDHFLEQLEWAASAEQKRQCLSKGKNNQVSLFMMCTISCPIFHCYSVTNNYYKCVNSQSRVSEMYKIKLLHIMLLVHEAKGMQICLATKHYEKSWIKGI